MSEYELEMTTHREWRPDVEGKRHDLGRLRAAVALALSENPDEIDHALTLEISSYCAATYHEPAEGLRYIAQALIAAAEAIQ